MDCKSGSPTCCLALEDFFKGGHIENKLRGGEIAQLVRAPELIDKLGGDHCAIRDVTKMFLCHGEEPTCTLSDMTIQC